MWAQPAVQTSCLRLPFFWTSAFLGWNDRFLSNIPIFHGEMGMTHWPDEVDRHEKHKEELCLFFENLPGHKLESGDPMLNLL